MAYKLKNEGGAPVVLALAAEAGTITRPGEVDRSIKWMLNAYQTLGRYTQNFADFVLPYIEQLEARNRALEASAHLAAAPGVEELERKTRQLESYIGRIYSQTQSTSPVGKLKEIERLCMETVHADVLNNNLHPATASLVDRFTVALKAKLLKAEQKHGYTDGWKKDDWKEDCQRKLLEHIAKGDPRDVAAYCAFLWHHDWPTDAPAQPDTLIREALAPTPPPLLVWWVSQDAQEQMGDSAGRMLRNCPDYIKSEFRSREGRPGRGRLWISKHLGDVGIDPWPETECTKAAENCGGIVIEGIHYKHVCKLPGFVTDLGLNLYEPREPDIEAALAALAAAPGKREVV